MRGWLFAATFITVATAFWGVVWSTAIVVGTLSSKWVALGLGISGVLALVLIVGIGALGALKSGYFQAAATSVGLFSFVFFILRFLLPFFPIVGTVGFFAASVALAIGSVGSFFGVIDAVAPVMRRLPLNGQLLATGILGQLAGTAGAVWGLRTLAPTSSLLVVCIGSFVAAMLLGSLAARSDRRPRPQVSKVQHVMLAKTLRRRYSLVTGAGLVSFTAFALLSQGMYLAFRVVQLHSAHTIETWSRLLGTVFGLGALGALGVLALSRLWLWRHGAFLLICCYPVLLLIPLIWWALEPNLPAGAVMAATFHAALLPSLLLPILRYSLTPISRRFLPGATMIASSLSGAAGLIAGGFGWFLLSPYMPITSLVRTTAGLHLVLLGLAVGLALSYRWHWIDRLRRPPWRMKVAFGEDVAPARVRELLLGNKPAEVEFGLGVVDGASQPELYMDALASVMEHRQNQEQAMKLLAVLGKCSEPKLRNLFGHKMAPVRTRALLAAVRHGVPIPLDQLTTLLQDESPWVRVVACIAAWQLGLEDLADVAWQRVSLATLSATDLVETCQSVGSGWSSSGVYALKVFARHPSAEVQAAVLGAWVDYGEHRGLDDPALFKAVTEGVEHTSAAMRQAALRLARVLDPTHFAPIFDRLMGDLDSGCRQAAADGLANAGSLGVEYAAAALGSRCVWVELAAMRALECASPVGRAILDRYLDDLYDRVHASLPNLAGTVSEAAHADDLYLGLQRRYAWVAQLRGYQSIGFALGVLGIFDPKWSEAASGTLGRWVVPNTLLAKALRLYHLRNKWPSLVT